MKSGYACVVGMFFVLAVQAVPHVCFAENSRPNMLIIMADDCTYNDLPMYGGKNAKTPHLNKLASSGLVFNQAWLCSAMCQPCRAELFTGQYPLTNGCAWNHSASRNKTKSLPQYLKPLGYRVGLAGKVHVKPASAFPFEKVAGFDPNCVRNPTRTHNLFSLREFISAANHTSPFCLVVALVEPHLPWVMGDASQYPPKKISLPPNLADTLSTREHYANYLAEITYMDSQVGEILQALQESGSAENTLVLFTSEQGSQFPGCKWTNWNTGVHTAFIASWPGKIPAGKRTDALIQYADILPTLVELAGGKQTADVNGSSFVSVLLGAKHSSREYVFGMHNNLPEGPAFPIRSVTDGQFHYIRNLTPNEIYIEKHLMGPGRLNNPYWATWLGADPLKQPLVYQLTKRYMFRPAEQLYSLADDPYELQNLAEDPKHQKIKRKLQSALAEWMKQQHDPGKEVDTVKALQAARKGQHLHGPHVRTDN